MRTTRLLTALAAAGTLAACGSAGSTQSALDAAPTYQSLALDQTSADTTEPTGVTASAIMVGGDACHPHLFVRSHEVVSRINRHLYKFLRFVEGVISKNPTEQTDNTWTWEKVRNGIDVKFTMTKTGEVYAWTLALGPQGSTDLTPVFTGQIDRTGATGPHQGVGSLTLDLDALATVVPLEPARGVVQAQFDVQAASRKMVVDASNVRWDVQDDMMPSDALNILEQPRSGHYVYFSEKGKGGSLKLTDQMVLLCPAQTLPLKLADVSLVERWYRTSTGEVHGRSDALFTGGQLPDHTPPIAKIVGVTCRQSADQQVFPTETFWLMKAEDASGGTITGADTSVESTTGASACDPALNPPDGTVPDLQSDASDFVFPDPATMSSDDAYPFPGM